jgi:hypothetical protein
MPKPDQVGLRCTLNWCGVDGTRTRNLLRDVQSGEVESSHEDGRVDEIVKPLNRRSVAKECSIGSESSFVSANLNDVRPFFRSKSSKGVPVVKRNALREKSLVVYESMGLFVSAGAAG